MKDLVVVVLVLVGIGTACFSYFSMLLSRGRQTRMAGSSREHARVISELGPVVETFTSHNPWRFRFGLAMLIIGTGCVVAIKLAEVPNGVHLLAGFSLLFGIATLLYVAFAQIKRLDLHVRGLALYQGKASPVAAYYPDISTLDYETVSLVTNGVSGRPIARGLEISFRHGGSMEISRDFVGFGKIADAIQVHASACKADGTMTGPYLVIGTHINSGTPEETTIEADSPNEAKHEALRQFGIVADSCRKLPATSGEY